MPSPAAPARAGRRSGSSATRRGGTGCVAACRRRRAARPGAPTAIAGRRVAAAARPRPRSGDPSRVDRPMLRRSCTRAGSPRPARHRWVGVRASGRGQPRSGTRHRPAPPCHKPCRRCPARPPTTTRPTRRRARRRPAVGARKGRRRRTRPQSGRCGTREFHASSSSSARAHRWRPDARRRQRAAV